MSPALFTRLLLCVLILGLFLYGYINKQTKIIQLRLKIPRAAAELQTLEEENAHLQFEIESFENPQRLMQLARNPQFSHLKHPHPDDLITLEIPK